MLTNHHDDEGKYVWVSTVCWTLNQLTDKSGLTRNGLNIVKINIVFWIKTFVIFQQSVCLQGCKIDNSSYSLIKHLFIYKAQYICKKQSKINSKKFFSFLFHTVIKWGRCTPAFPQGCVKNVKLQNLKLTNLNTETKKEKHLNWNALTNVCFVNHRLTHIHHCQMFSLSYFLPNREKKASWIQTIQFKARLSPLRNVFCFLFLHSDVWPSPCRMMYVQSLTLKSCFSQSRGKVSLASP